MIDSLRSMALFLFFAGFADAEAPRARPPEWTDDQRALFAEDARELLVGPRPEFGQAAAASVAELDRSDDSRDNQSEWSAFISADVIETEIKRQASDVADNVRSATSFKGGGYRDCRDAFSVLAVMFAITAEHDGDPRWRDRASGLAMLFARAGANCKVGTDGSYREAAARSEDLAQLVRGGRPDVPRGAAIEDWGQIADRAPLMRRMKLTQEQRLTPLLANARAFSRGANTALHEAQVLASLSEVLTREGFEDADDGDYTKLAREVRDAAAEISRAADNGSYESSRAALGRSGQACAACHENYRG